MVQSHAEEQTKNQKVSRLQPEKRRREVKEVDKDTKRLATSLRRAVTAGRQTGRDATRSKRPIEGRNIIGG